MTRDSSAATQAAGSATGTIRCEAATADLATKLKALKLESRIGPLMPDPMRSEGRRWSAAAKPALLGAAAVLLVGAGLLAGPIFRDSAAREQRPATSGLARAAGPDQAASGSLVATGYVVARRQATVAAQVLGQVRSLHVEEGQRVAAGALLANLDAAAVQAETDTSGAMALAGAAEARSIRARLTEAEAMLARTSELAARGFARRADLSAREAEMLSLRADLAAATARVMAQQASHRAARSVLGHYQIRAPFSGVVTRINAQPGEVISPGSAGGFTRTGICTMVDMASLEVEADVAESHISRIAAGQPVSITLAAYPDRPYPGEVIALVPIADRSRASFRVRVRFAALDGNILPEMAANVSFKERNAA